MPRALISVFDPLRTLAARELETTRTKPVGNRLKKVLEAGEGRPRAQALAPSFHLSVAAPEFHFSALTPGFGDPDRCLIAVCEKLVRLRDVGDVEEINPVLLSALVDPRRFYWRPWMHSYPRTGKGPPQRRGR